MKTRITLLSGVVALGLSGSAWADDQLTTPEVTVIAKRLDDARNSLNPDIGASAYVMDSDAINDLPLGGNSNFNKVLAQMPGVAPNSMGQVHVRGDHANLQYRINGILMPEGISGFGSAIDSRMIDQVSLITGTLPAQYGFRTAGVVDIHTRSGAFENGGTTEMQVGSDSSIQPSFTYSGHDGGWNYFVSGDFLSSNRGVEPPTSNMTPLHDTTDQGKGFGYFSYIIDPYNRIDVIMGSSVSRYNIPNNPNQDTSYTVGSLSAIPSASLRENQVEQSHYTTVAWQGDQGEYSWQMAPYVRWTETHFQPDVIGDLQYNGLAADIQRSDMATGIQMDGGWKMNPAHTVRSGLLFQHDQLTSDNSSTVLSDVNNVVGATPYVITDNNNKQGILAGVYVQDEWRLNDQLTLNYGLRFDQVSAYVSENQISPRVGLVYRATKDTTLHAGYARTFTPPPFELVSANTLTKFDNTTAASPVQQDDAVKSERAHSFDLGVVQKMGDHMQIGWDSYAKLVRNLLDEGQFGSALLFTPFNYQEGRVFGSEVTFSYTDKDTTAYTNVAVSQAMGRNIVSSQFTFGQDELNYIANHWVHLDHDQTVTVSSGIGQAISDLTKVSLDGILGTGLRRGFANTDHMPVYTQFDASITHHLPIDTEGIDLKLAMLNLLDTPYQINDGTGIGTAAAHWGVRRTLYLSASRRF